MRQSFCFLVNCCLVFLSGATLRADIEDVSALQYSEKGHLLAAGYNDGRIALLEIASGKTLWDLPGPGKQILSLYFRDKDTQLIAFERRGHIRCLDAATGREVKKLQPRFGHFRDDVESRLALAEFDQASDLIALADDMSSTLYLVNAKRALAGSENLILGTGEMRIDSESGLVLWSRGDSKQGAAVESALIADVRGGFANMRYSSKYGLVAAITEERQLLFVWKFTSNPSTGKKQSPPVMREFGQSQNLSTGLAIGAGGDVVTVGITKKYGDVQLWDFARTELIHWPDYSHPGSAANRAVFSHSGEIVVTSDEIVNCVWKKTKNKLEPLGRFWHGRMTDLYDRPNAIAFSPDDQELAVGLGPAVGLTPVEDLKSVKFIGRERPPPGKNPLTGE